MMHPAQRLLLQLKAGLAPAQLAQLEAVQSKNPHADLVKETMDWILEEDELICEAAQLYQICGLVFPWRFGKLVLKVDPQLSASLATSEMDSIPAQILQTLPFRFFYIALESAPKVWTKTGSHVALGAFIRYLPASMLADSHFLSVAVGFQVEVDADGEPACNWQPLHVGGDSSLSFDESMAATRAITDWPIDMGDPSAILAKNKPLLCYLMRIIAYLCSKNSDYQAPALDHSPVKTRRGLRAFESKMHNTVIVGAAVGGQIRAFMEQKGAMGASGIMPHTRRAHFAIFHTGRNRTKQELIWRSESFINSAEPAVPIVRKVG